MRTPGTPAASAEVSSGWNVTTTASSSARLIDNPDLEPIAVSRPSVARRGPDRRYSAPRRHGDCSRHRAYDPGDGTAGPRGNDLFAGADPVQYLWQV